MQRRPSPRPAWLTTAAAVWRSDAMFRIGLMILGALLMLLLTLRAK
jgi:hypothetical protein